MKTMFIFSNEFRLIVCVSATRHQFKLDLLKKFIVEKCIVEFDVDILGISSKSQKAPGTFSKLHADIKAISYKCR